MRPIVLLHGFTGSPRSWRGVIERLGDAVTIAPPLVGERVESFRDELHRLASLIDRAPVHLAGYSLGARLALGLIVEHPELVASATLIGVHPGLANASERAARRLADAAWCDRLESDGVAAFVAAWEAQPLFGSEARLTDAQRAEQREIRHSHGAPALCRALRTTGLAEMPCYVERARDVSARIDLLVGEHDSKFRTLCADLALRLPHATLEVVSDAGHNLPLECPDVVARAIARGANT